MRKLSLKARMSFSVMALVLVLMASVGGLALVYFEQSFRQLIAGQQSTLVRQIAAQIDNQLADASALITAVAEGFPLDHLADAELAQAYLDSRLGRGTTSLFDNGIFLFTAEGLMLAEYPFKPDRRGRDYSFRAYFQDTLRTGRPQISDPYISSQGHRHPAVNFTAPIRAEGGEILAVIAGSVDLTHKNFLGGLSDVKIGQSGYLYLYNTDRLMIMHPDPRRIMQKDVPVGANVWFDRAIEGFEGTEETVNSRGLHTLVTFKRLNHDRWILAANYPSREALAPIRQARRLALIGLGAFLLISLAVTWAVTRILLAPLQRLTLHVAGFSADRDGMPAPGQAQADEIEALALTFDALMDQVAEQRRAADTRLAFLQGIIDTIPHPIFYKDLDGRLLGCNEAMQTLCGKPLETMVGMPLQELCSAETAEQLIGGDPTLVQGESRLVKRELTLDLPGGEFLDALVYKALLRDGTGQPQGIVSSLVDINELKAVETALAKERELSQNLLQNSATPCFVIDPRHKVVIWTRALEELTGIKAHEVLDTDQHWRAFYSDERPCLADIVLDQDFAGAIDQYQVLANSVLIQDGLQSEGWRRLFNGKSRYLTFDAAPIHDRDGTLVAVIETLHDLTNLKQTEEALRETQISYHTLVESSPDAILVHRHGIILYANRAATQLFGAENPTALVGRSFDELISSDSREAVFSQIAAIETRQNDTLYAETRVVDSDGQIFDVEVGWSLTYYAGEAAVQSVMRDITDRLAEQERVWRQANFDSLTGLPNRSLFMDRLEQVLSRCQRDGYLGGLLFIDLDHFKEINDTLGHENGDELLRQVARRMSDCLRQTDTVARLGGDEFVVILPILKEPDEARLAALRLLKVLEDPFVLPAGTRRISCSIGAAIYPRDGRNIADLLSVADASMYQVKQSGRNGYYSLEQA